MENNGYNLSKKIMLNTPTWLQRMNRLEIGVALSRAVQPTTQDESCHRNWVQKVAEAI